MTDPDIARLLLLRMRDLSEDYWCAGWLIGTEYALWKMVRGEGNRKWGLGTVSEEEVAELKRLAEKCGGWWTWSDDDDRERFVALEEWERIYEKCR